MSRCLGVDGYGWLVRCWLAGLPVQHSEYIELAMEMLVQPVVVAVNQLQTDAQLTALTAAVTSLCEAWSSNILTHKIRFRYETQLKSPCNTLHHDRSWGDVIL